MPILEITWRLLLWFVPIGANIYADRKGRKPNYLMMFVIRGACAIVHGALFVSDYENYWYYWWPVLVFQATSFWIFFELGLNITYRMYHPDEYRSLLYYDTKERDSGAIDKFFAWTGTWAHTLAKVIALALMIHSIVLIFQRGVQP